MRTITYKAPVLHSKGALKGQITHVEKHGIPARLYVGAYQLHFALQFEGEDVEPSKLVHVPTGMIFGSLRDAGVRYLCSRGTGRIPSPRECAEYLIADVCAKHGADAVLVKINAATVINP
jgi:hypothetical protein